MRKLHLQELFLGERNRVEVERKNKTLSYKDESENETNLDIGRKIDAMIDHKITEKEIHFFKKFEELKSEMLDMITQTKES